MSILKSVLSGTGETETMQPESSFDYIRSAWPAMLLGLLLTSLFPGNLIAGPPGPGGGPPPLVTVEEITVQDVNPPEEYVGHVVAIQSVDLRARVEGFLEQVNFREGGCVHSGDLLYVIEQAPYQARVKADKAALLNASAAHTRARQYLRRVQTVDPGGVPATDIDDAISGELQAAAALQKAEAELTLSELDLGYTTITAPISGRIGRTAYTMGNLVGPASGPLSRIVQLDPIRVVYSISENDLTAIKTVLEDSAPDKKEVELKIRLKLPGGKILKKTGQVDFADNKVDAATGTIAVWAVFENHDGLLLPGQYVTVLVSKNKAAQLPMVPQAAVLEDRSGHYVLIVDKKNKVIQRSITTGPLIGARWAVESGLSKGDLVIVQGVQKVRPGQVVKTTTAGRQNRR